MDLVEREGKSQYKDILTVFSNFPLWLQQVLFADFKAQLNISSESILSNFQRNELFALYTPLLTIIGEHEKNTRANNLPQSLYTFLIDASNGLNITEMAIKNNLPLNALAIIFIKCLEKELITPVRYEKILYMAEYLAGKIITGEFLVQIGKISRMDLNEAFNYQAIIQKKTGDKVDITNILVAKKYVSKEYVKSVLKYFVDCKRKIKELNSEVIACNSRLDIENLKSTNEKLLKENKIIKERLSKILNISAENE